MGSSSFFGRWDIGAATFSALASPPAPGIAAWGSPALSAGAIWQLRPGAVLKYDIGTDTWITVRSDLHTGEDHAMTVTADGNGHLWGYNSMGELVEYDPLNDIVSYYPSGIATSSFETRLGYDSLTNSIYFGGFSVGNLYRFDIATATVTALTSHPEGFLNDIFCSDHSGHLYAAGDSGGVTLWQYDIATDTWNPIPDFPIDHGNNGSCGVLEDGWLYMEPGDGTMYRLELF
jgi:hypothetical protein